MDMAGKSVSAAARQLSKLGASKGGVARRDNMTSEQRTESARLAAAARWKIPRATFEGTLRIGEIPIPCYVLDNGTRLISHRGLQRSLGIAVSGGAQNTARFVGLIEAKVQSNKNLTARISAPIDFIPPNYGRSAYGYEATVLADVCELILSARQLGVIGGSRMERMAAQCEILVRGFARVGVVALVDEATGYQKVRQRDELHKILEAYIAKELLPWTKRFPDEFYEEMFRLRGWGFDPESCKRPILVGKLTESIVYKRLPNGVLEELKKKNPKDEKGRRKYTHHRFLTENVGNPHLEKHLAVVTALMRASSTWKRFLKLLNKAVPRPSGEQKELFEDEDDE
jgi:hypothetical protein